MPKQRETIFGLVSFLAKLRVWEFSFANIRIKKLNSRIAGFFY